MAPDLPVRPLPRRSGHLPSERLVELPMPGPRTAGHRPAARPTALPGPVPVPPAPPGGSAWDRPAGASRRRARPWWIGLVVMLVVAAVAGVALLARAAQSHPTQGLDPDLQDRFTDAVADAAQEGVTLTLTSGWRSAEQQQRLVDDAVAKHGSLEEARRWVLPPEASAHVAGLAIDVGPTAGALWLGERSERYGLCRTYANEAWHFEPVIAPGGSCPAMLEDSSAGWTGHS